MRTLVTLLFIAVVAAGALYAAQRPTIAKGDVIGAVLTESNKSYVRAMHCDPEIPIGVDGAHFACRAIFKDGASARLEFAMDRKGTITQAAAHPQTRVKRTTDPWGD